MTMYPCTSEKMYTGLRALYGIKAVVWLRKAGMALITK